MNLINEQFEKALEVDRLDLLFRSPSMRKKSKKQVIAPLIITFNPGNPPVRTWIEEGLEFLHTDPAVKKILPHIDVVFRQDKNIRSRIMRNRYKSKRNTDRHYSCQTTFCVYFATCELE